MPTKRIDWVASLSGSVAIHHTSWAAGRTESSLTT